jgi:hypothetical protein
MVHSLGGEKVGLWCVFWVKIWSVYAGLEEEQLDEWQLYEKEPTVFWAKRWSALEGEQLDGWQLYVEGRERGYCTFAGL